MHKFTLSFVVISDVYRSRIPNKTTFTKYCLTQWISRHPGCLKIHRVRPYRVNFSGLVGILNELFTRPSQFSQVSGMANYVICYTAMGASLNYMWVNRPVPNHNLKKHIKTRIVCIILENTSVFVCFHILKIIQYAHTNDMNILHDQE